MVFLIARNQYIRQLFLISEAILLLHFSMNVFKKKNKLQKGILSKVPTYTKFTNMIKN